MSGLRTRKPTGQVAWPVILLEGEEKTGKSYAAYSLSADPRVGRTFVFEFGEGIADEYGTLGPYEIVQHNGTYADLYDQLKAACAEPVEAGKTNVVVIDQMTELWDLLNRWAEHRARSSKSAAKKLKADPNAEIEVTANLHNDKADRWYRVVNLLRHNPLVGVLVCRGKEVTKFHNGQPVSGETDYTIQGHKGTPFAAKAHVRMSKPHTATLLGVASLNVDVPTNGLRLPDDNPLGHLVFDILGCGPDSVARTVVQGSLGIPVPEAMKKVLDVVTRQGATDPKATARALWDAHIPGGTSEVSPDQLVALLDLAAEVPPASDEEHYEQGQADAEVFNGGGASDAPDPLPDNGKKAHDEAKAKLQPKTEADS